MPAQEAEAVLPYYRMIIKEERKGKRYPKVIAAVLAATTLFSTVASAAEGFAGWNAENKDDAWTVYTTTDWNSMAEYMVLENNSSSTQALHLSTKVNSLRNTVKDTLKNLDDHPGLYKNTAYTELMLAMIQVLSGGNPSADDPCCIKTYIDPDARDMTAEKSIRKLFYRLTACEEAHAVKYGETSVYANNEALQAVVQGVVLGTKYARETEKYSVSNAQAYIDGHREDLHGNPSASFAREVGKRYTATQSGSQYVGNQDNEVARKIVEAAYTQLGTPYVWGGTTPYRGLDCSGLTQYCHRMAGVTIPRTSGPQGSGGMAVTTPEPGDIVCYSGHVGIYIGGGQMIHAPQPGQVVCIVKVWGNPWYRRYW